MGHRIFRRNCQQKVVSSRSVAFVARLFSLRLGSLPLRTLLILRTRCLYAAQHVHLFPFRVTKKYSAVFNSIFINNPRFRLFSYNSQFQLTFLASRLQLDCFLNPIRLFCRLPISPLRTRSLGVRGHCHVAFFEIFDERIVEISMAH